MKHRWLSGPAVVGKQDVEHKVRACLHKVDHSVELLVGIMSGQVKAPKRDSHWCGEFLPNNICEGLRNQLCRQVLERACNTLAPSTICTVVRLPQNGQN